MQYLTTTDADFAADLEIEAESVAFEIVIKI